MSYLISVILTSVLIGVSSHFLSKYNNDGEGEKNKNDLIIGIIFSILSVPSFAWLVFTTNNARKLVQNKREFIELYDLISFNFGIVIFLLICIPLLANYNVKRARDGNTTPLIVTSVALSILIVLFALSFYKIRDEKLRSIHL